MVLAGWFSNSAPPLLIRAVRAYKQLELGAVATQRSPKVTPGRALQLSSSQIANLAAEHRQGATVAALAVEYRVHTQTVVKHLHARGIETDRRMSETEAQTAIQLYAEGWSLERIGTKLGWQPTTIRNVLVRAGIERRDSRGRARS